MNGDTERGVMDTGTLCGGQFNACNVMNLWFICFMEGYFSEFLPLELFRNAAYQMPWLVFVWSYLFVFL